MLFPTPRFLFLILISSFSALAQTSSDVEVEGVVANFKNALLSNSPNTLFPSFAPKGLIEITFGSSNGSSINGSTPQNPTQALHAVSPSTATAPVTIITSTPKTEIYNATDYPEGYSPAAQYGWKRGSSRPARREVDMQKVNRAVARMLGPQTKRSTRDLISRFFGYERISVVKKRQESEDLPEGFSYAALLGYRKRDEEYPDGFSVASLLGWRRKRQNNEDLPEGFSFAALLGFKKRDDEYPEGFSVAQLLGWRKRQSDLISKRQEKHSDGISAAWGYNWGHDKRAPADAIRVGENVTVDFVASAPTVTFTAFQNASSTNRYTVMLIDADVAGTDPTKEITHHWLVNDVTLSGSTVNVGAGTVVTPYTAPGPLPRSGSHRYVLVLHDQPPSFKPDSTLEGFGTFKYSDYVSQTGLGDVVGATYFIVTAEGPSTVQASPTSQVLSSTLSGFASAATNTVTLSKSSGAASPTSTKASSGERSVAVGGLVGIVGLMLVFLW